MPGFRDSVLHLVDTHGIVAGVILGGTFAFGSIGAVMFGTGGFIVLALILGLAAGVALALGIYVTVLDSRRRKEAQTIHRAKIRRIRQDGMRIARAETRTIRQEEIGAIRAEARVLQGRSLF